jgi:putative transposase
MSSRALTESEVAARFVRSIRESCLSRLVLIGESSLRRAVDEFVTHYQQERNHQGLGNKIIMPEFASFPGSGEIACRERLGGMLRYYYRQAA